MLSITDLTITGFSAEQGTGRAVFETVETKERVRRAALGLGMAWGIALLGFFIPLAHFFIVPIGLVAGVVIAFRHLRHSTVMTECEGKCPDCGEKQSFELPWGITFPASARCASCSRSLTLKNISP